MPHLAGEDGQFFYVVLAGRFEARLDQRNGALVAEYAEGSCFGELALLYNTRRAASVRCAVGAMGGVLWALDRASFRRLLQGREDHLARALAALTAHPLFSTLQVPRVQLQCTCVVCFVRRASCLCIVCFWPWAPPHSHPTF